MSEAMAAVNQQNYPQAIAKLQDARQVYNQLSNFYLDLNNSFAGIDNRVSDSHRQKALETAQLRDQATYQLAIAYRANNQPELAIPVVGATDSQPKPHP
jgi:predicted patatin/cPLA2 family phospholipase